MVHKQYHEILCTLSLDQVSYAEVEHWMWRLFLSDFGQACEAVGIPSVPLAAASQETHAQLPPPTPLLYGISPTVMARQSYWPERYACRNASSKELNSIHAVYSKKKCMWK